MTVTSSGLISHTNTEPKTITSSGLASHAATEPKTRPAPAPFVTFRTAAALVFLILAVVARFGSAGLVLLLVASALVLSHSVHLVQPGRRKIVLSFDNQLIVLQPGLTVQPTAPWFRISTGPFKGMARGQAWPAAGTRVTLDPPLTNVNTTEGISADVDISVECTVSDWTADTQALVADTGSIPQRAASLTNQWLSEQCAALSVNDIRYATVVQLLNSSAALAALNSKLADSQCPITASRVLIDPNGVRLAPENARRRLDGLTKAQEQATEQACLAKEAELQRLRHANAAADAEFALEQARLAAVPEIELAKLARAAAAERAQAEASRAGAFVAAGLLPEHVAAIIVAETGATALRSAKAGDRLVVASAGTFGLAGLAGVPGFAQHSAGPAVTAHDIDAVHVPKQRSN